MTFVVSLVLAVVTAVTPIALPPAGGTADYQLGGAYRPAASVDIVVRDRTAKPASGVYSVCYVNAFQTQPGRLSWWRKKHPGLLLRDGKGRLVRDRDWPGEVLLDLRTAKKRAAAARIARRWFAGCAERGFRAVEPDNLDSWTRSKKLLKRSHARAHARLLVRAAHAERLAIAQKNTAGLNGRKLGFDFAVAEECEVYRECGRYTRMYGRRVIEVEYTDNGRKAFDRACRARGSKISVVLRDRDLVARGRPGHVFRTC
ncbi:endo alpha-1,4 polygalactosaminidase [Aeromicrobium duanguangcaii]|uniref:Endo alpha-1,4 polygalactosaminidase n=1 Tax=Aeromicrobium duanguangcaii TaxID=2968086 RepID=A0ABY5KEA4_9ACTN|nr:endo alpha-1,4 polygalactosaminidase [Aeromicrobium duanguangcaii]MCD9155126.1 endo alpha-1,4 polygalactosaminidase [Aeromicrobium duanguangcaii]UUI68220.1 endo alpha-1,4 polygalactosaminidase [Aeromicrobium duanguangcaii]